MLVFSIYSCRKTNTNGFEDTPYLEWREAEVETDASNRKSIILKVYFNDRDGDVGTDNPSSDSCNTESYNLFVRYFEKVGTSYEEVLPADSCSPFHSNLPDLTPEGQNKVLEGVVNSAFSYLGYPQNASADSIKFELQLKDRAGNLSNIAYSPPIATPR